MCSGILFDVSCNFTSSEISMGAILSLSHSQAPKNLLSFALRIILYPVKKLLTPVTYGVTIVLV